MVVAAIALAPAFPPAAAASHTHPAFKTKKTESKSKSKPKSETDTPAVQPNPLLPPPIAVDALWPDLSMVQKLPAITPAGLQPVYTPQDWADYQSRFGGEAATITAKKGSVQLEFCQTLIAAALAASPTSQPSTAPALPTLMASTPNLPPSGFSRLLLLRAAAIAYRHRDGYPVANKAVEALQEVTDVSQPMQVAALFDIASAMARQSVTPKPERARYDIIAVRANLQLCLQLMNLGQAEAALAVAHFLARHDTAAMRANVPLHRQMQIVRHLVEQNALMARHLAQDDANLQQGDPRAAMPLYLFAKFISPHPEIIQDLTTDQHRTLDVVQLDRALDDAQHDVTKSFFAAEALKRAAANLDPGYLKARTLDAALHQYRAFLNSPLTEDQRIRRTLCRLAIQQLIADGAEGPPTLKPYGSATTAAIPATTQPQQK